METDYEGHFIGSSFSFATARDWGRVGQLLLQHGHWRGQWLIPRHFVEQMVMKPLASSGGVCELTLASRSIFGRRNMHLLFFFFLARPSLSRFGRLVAYPSRRGCAV